MERQLLQMSLQETWHMNDLYIAYNACIWYLGISFDLAHFPSQGLDAGGVVLAGRRLAGFKPW